MAPLQGRAVIIRASGYSSTLGSHDGSKFSLVAQDALSNQHSMHDLFAPSSAHDGEDRAQKRRKLDIDHSRQGDPMTFNENNSIVLAKVTLDFVSINVSHHRPFG